MKMVKALTIFIGALFFSTMALGSEAGNPYTAETVDTHMSDCRTAPNNIRYFCSQSSDLVLAQQRTNALQLITNGSRSGTGQQLRDGETTANYTRESLNSVRNDCRAAFDKCNRVCTDEANRLRSEASRNPAAAESLMEQSNQMRQNARTCQQEQATLETQASALNANLGEILAAIAMIMQQLGIGQGGGDGTVSAASTDEEEDKCSGEYAHLLIECKDESGPSSTRGGLSGVASLNGRTSGGLGSLSDGADGGEPGGEDKGFNSGDGDGGGNPFGGAGAGGAAGLAGGAGGAAGGEAGEKEGFDTDINKGYLGTGGGFGGGGGGGGSAGGGRYNPVSPLAAAGNGIDKAALQKKLNKFANDSARKPASLGGANGPFDDNWMVIKKAYKQNSSSLYHQQ